MGEHEIKWRRTTFLDLDIAGDKGILDESMIKIN